MEETEPSPKKREREEEEELDELEQDIEKPDEYEDEQVPVNEEMWERARQNFETIIEGVMKKRKVLVAAAKEFADELDECYGHVEDLQRACKYKFQEVTNAFDPEESKRKHEEAGFDRFPELTAMKKGLYRFEKDYLKVLDQIRNFGRISDACICTDDTDWRELGNALKTRKPPRPKCGFIRWSAPKTKKSVEEVEEL